MTSKEREPPRWEILEVQLEPGTVDRVCLPTDYIRKIGYPFEVQIENVYTKEVHNFPKKIPIIIATESYFHTYSQKLQKEKEKLEKEGREVERERKQWYENIYLIAIPDEGEVAFIDTKRFLINAVETNEGIYVGKQKVGYNPVRLSNGSKIKVGKSEFQIKHKYPS